MSKELTPKIIGIAGTNGSGKDTIGKLLSNEHNFMFVSVTDILRQELKLRGLPPAREHMRNLSAEWRRKYGLGVLVDKAKQIYDAQDGYEGLAMASLRNPGEVDAVHKYGGIVIWVDADARIRYDRLQLNIQARGQERGVDDNKSFEEFLADEAAEMDHPEGADNATLSLSGVKAKSDIFLTNDGHSLETLSRELNAKLNFAA